MSQEQINNRMQAQAAKARDKIVELSKALEKEKQERMGLQREFNDLENLKEDLENEKEDLEEQVETLTRERDSAFWIYFQADLKIGWVSVLSLLV